MASVGALVACGALLNVDDDPPPPPPETETPTFAGETPPPPPPLVEGGAPPPVQCATRREVDVKPEADTCIFSLPDDRCPGSISDGSTRFCNVGFGMMLARFKLTPEIAEALRSGKVASMSLWLFDNRRCDAQNAGESCNVVPKAGRLTAHVLRNDWTESTTGMSTYSGADQCRRTANPPNQGWGNAQTASNKSRISAPADYGESVGAGAIEHSDVSSVSLLLEPRQTATEWSLYAPSPNALALSLLVKAERENEARIVAGTRESKLASPPTLRLEICEE